MTRLGNRKSFHTHIVLRIATVMAVGLSRGITIVK